MKLITRSEYENEMGEKLAARIHRYTPPIYEKEDSREKFNHLGSSILLRWEAGYYLVLAAHTRTKKSGGRYFTIKNDDGFIGMSGHGKGNSMDNIDVQFIRLDENCIEMLNEIGYDFFDLKKIAIDHDDLKGADYMVVGYPNSRVKILSEKLNSFRSELFSFRTKIVTNQELLKKLKLVNDFNIMLHYERKKIYKAGKMQIGPEPQGISGCGIWRVSSFINPNSDAEAIDIIPTGIVTRYDAKSDVLIGTRLRVIADGIRTGFEPNMPVSRRLRRR